MTRRETTTRQAKMTAVRAGREHAEPPGPGWQAVLLRVAGAGLLIAAGAIHLDLYLTGYRSIPTIGWLVLLQVIAAFGLGLAVLVLRSRLAAVAAAGFSLATLGGYLLSVWIGLFGFKEVRTTAGIVAGVLEVAAFAALAGFALAAAPAPAQAVAPPRGPARALAQLPAATLRAAGMAAAGLSVVALVLLGIAVAGAGGSGPATTRPAAAAGLKTATIGGATVLTNAKGFTLYSFAPDTATKSACYGSCAAYWPPVTGPAVHAAGLPGAFGTTMRTDGTTQVTYNGHPLYTYIGDSAPGQAHGNNLNLNGGLWHAVRVSR
jgi:predicted lipoprotein with Yx(FWY)xxD motif